MPCFSKPRYPLGTLVLLISTALLAGQTQLANALPANQGRTAPVNQGQAGANLGQANVNQGQAGANQNQQVLGLLNQLAGLAEQAQNMGLNIPGLDEAIRALANDLMGGGHHHHHHHKHHHHHHGFAGGMDQVGGQVNGDNQINAGIDQQAAADPGMADPNANAQTGPGAVGNGQNGNGQGGGKANLGKVGGQSRAANGMQAAGQRGGKGGSGKTAAQVGGQCSCNQGEKRGGDPNGNKGQANGQCQFGKGMQAMAGTVGGKQGKVAKNASGQVSSRSGQAGQSVGNRASVTINGNNDTVKVVLGPGNNAAKVTINGNNDRVRIVGGPGNNAAKVTINGNNDKVSIVAASKMPGGQAHQMNAQPKTNTSAVAANTANKNKAPGNTVAANTVNKTAGNTVAATPKQVANQPKATTPNAGGTKPTGALAKAIQPIKAAGNLSFIPKGGQAKTTTVAPKPPQQAARPSVINRVAQGAKTVANFSKAGGGKKK